MLTQHYRTPLDFSHDNLNSAKAALQGLDEAYSRLIAIVKDNDNNLKDENLVKIQKQVKDSLDDDFNFERALSYLHELKNIILNNLSQDKQDLLKQAKWLFEDILEGALGVRVLKEETTSDLQTLLDKRNQARKEKNWAVADECRNKLSELGYKIIDNKDGTSTLVKRI